MALSKEWFDYHLAEDGWHTGSEKLDSGAKTTRTEPNDTVLSVRVREEIPSIGSPLHKSRRIYLKTDEVERIKALLDEYGRKPPEPGIDPITDAELSSE